MSTAKTIKTYLEENKIYLEKPLTEFISYNMKNFGLWNTGKKLKTSNVFEKRFKDELCDIWVDSRVKKSENISENTLKEKSINRLRSHMLKHDSALLTAYRFGYTQEENKKRNSEMLSLLDHRGYGVTRVLGRFRDDEGVIHTEPTFFVTNKGQIGKGDPKFKEDMIKLGEYFNQDSILYVPYNEDGSIEGYLIGTLKDTDQHMYTDVGYKQEEKIGKFNKIEDMATYFTSLKGNQKFEFGEMQEIDFTPRGSMLSLGMRKKLQKKLWEKVEEKTKTELDDIIRLSGIKNDQNV